MKGLLLLSDGIDSPVAGWMMNDVGMELDAIHFHNGETREKIKDLAKKSCVKKLFSVNLFDCNAAFRDKGISRYQCIFCKRTMYKIAERIAQKQGINFLITGENLGQVASQTLLNMQANDASVKMKVLRPLLSYDKTEIIAKAREIGSYDISIADQAKCGFLPNAPVTKAKLDYIEKQETWFDLIGLIEKAVDSAEIISLDS